ncbi:MAG: tetratricopeptide repeat protein [Chthoniobacterales bacterium]
MVFCFHLPSSQAQLPSEASTTDLFQNADSLVSRQKYAEAIPLLEELYKRLKDNPNTEIQTRLERMIYFLGLAYIIVNKPQQAIIYFNEYLKRYPDRSLSRAIAVKEMLADAYFSTEGYDEAAKLYAGLASNRQLPKDRQLGVKKNLLASYLLAKNWQAAIASGQVFLKDTNPEVQGDAAIALCQAWLATDKVNQIFSILPILEKTSSLARYQTTFNLELVDAADKLFGEGNSDLALALYQIVSPKYLIENRLEQEKESLEAQRQAVAKSRSGSAAFAVSSINARLQKLQNMQAQLAKLPSYDEELRSRLAQTYYKLNRKWEALWIFESLLRDYPESKYAENSGYAAFALAAELGQRELAVELANEYLDQFDEGENFNTLSLQFTQILTAANDYESAVEQSKKILELNPDHIFAGKIIFLGGYALLQQEKFNEAAEMFLKVRSDYPESESHEDAEYWYAMTFLFQSQYKKALDQFKFFATTYPETDLGIDAKFRIAVCYYALEDYQTAKQLLTEFLTDHLEEPQAAQAHTLLGDIAGGEGKLRDALEHYQKVENLTLVQSEIDYAMMASAKIYEALEAWDEMIQRLTAYLNSYGTDGLYAEAIYRIGFAKKQKGDTESMLNTYLEAIEQYGNKPSAVGIDLITQDWPKEYEIFYEKKPVEIVQEELKKTQSNDQETAYLRWQLIADNLGIANEHDPDAIQQNVSKEMLDAASPAVLVWLGERALTQKKPEIAITAYQKILNEFPENEWIEPALLGLAHIHRDLKENDKAIKNYVRLRELFPLSDSALTSLFEEADLLAAEQQYDQAIERLEMILEVKEWKGENWAHALYNIASLLKQQSKIQEAFAYFQRVYVLYSAYPDWTAKAYLASAECLAQLGKQDEYVNTLREMLSIDRLQNESEYATAQQKLKEL